MTTRNRALRRCGAGGVVALLIWCIWSAIPAGQPAYRPVSKAECGPGSRPESGLQGHKTAAERFSAGEQTSYNCNLELVGRYQGEGAAWDMGILDACAYIGTTDGPGRRNRGTLVLDVADSTMPTPVAYLDSPSFIEPNESLAVHAGRKLLAATKFHQGNFDVYDISECRRPTLKSSIKLSGIEGHAGNFAPDGRTYYGTSWRYEDRPLSPLNSVFAIDVSEPSTPREIARWTPEQYTVGEIHHVFINADGTRAYVSLMGPTANGFLVIDLSEIQTRQADPQFRLISRVVWKDGGNAQSAMPVTIGGQPYVISTDGAGASASLEAACGQGLPLYGFARFHDMRDERNPKLVGMAMLEAQDPAHCERILNGPPMKLSGMFCAVEDPSDVKLMACGYYDAGLRVFDVRDPGRPREIAYFKPPARGKEPIRPGSWFSYRPPGSERMADPIPFVGGFRPGGELWFMSHDGGFHVVRFTDWIKSAERALF